MCPNRVPIYVSADVGVLSALALDGTLTVDQLRRRLKVRRQRLLQSLSRLSKAGKIRKGSAKLLAPDKIVRSYTVYSLAEGTGAGSQAKSPGSSSQADQHDPVDSKLAAEPPGQSCIECFHLQHLDQTCPACCAMRPNYRTEAS